MPQHHADALRIVDRCLDGLHKATARTVVLQPLRRLRRGLNGYAPGMARPVWSGTISFGLVNVPVKAFTAVRDHDVHFHQLDKKSGARIRYEKVSEKTGREVDADDIEMGFEISEGKHVTFDKKELDALRPKSTKAIEITDFVALADVDPIYYERTYWLAPDGEAAARAYQLLLAAMEDRERVAIGSVAMRNKQYLTAIRPLDGVLAMSTMRFADEIVPRKEIDELPTRRTKPQAKELRMAQQLIDSLAGEWRPEQYEDTYVEELKARIKAKEAGKGVVEEEPSGLSGHRRSHSNPQLCNRRWHRAGQHRSPLCLAAHSATGGSLWPNARFSSAILSQARRGSRPDDGRCFSGDPREPGARCGCAQERRGGFQ